jgi:hypothetical protein
MGLFNGLLRANQAPAATQSGANDLYPASFVAELADALNPMAPESYQLPQAETPPTIADSKPRRKYRAPPAAKRYQLNVRVSAEHRTAIKRYARQHRIKLWEAVELAITTLTRGQ